MELRTVSTIEPEIIAEAEEVIIHQYQEYSRKMERAERLAKLLKKRRDQVAARLSHQYEKGSLTIQYAATVCYWGSDMSSKMVQEMLQCEPREFRKSLLPVFATRCRTCGTPMFLNSREQLRRGHIPANCKTCAGDLSNNNRIAWETLQADAGKQVEALRRMPYAEYLKTDHWQRIRRDMLRRSGYKCSVCGARRQLHVHHNSYENRGKEKRADLVVLCHKCHETFHEVEHA